MSLKQRANRQQQSQVKRTSKAFPPVGENALIGPAGEFVRTVEPHTEADPMALLIQFLVMAGNALGRTRFFTAEGDQHYSNLFACLIGKSAKARKGTSHGRVMQLFRLAAGESDLIKNWYSDSLFKGLSSGEGLLWCIRDPIKRTEPIKERGKVTDYQTVVVDPGIDDKRAMITESEFANVLKVMNRETNTLSPVLRDAWDTGNLRTMTKNSPARVTGGHVSIMAHVTAQELRRLLSSNECANGFGNRFLWCHVHRSKSLPDGGFVPDEELLLVARQIAGAVESCVGRGRLQRDEQARQLWHREYDRLSGDRYGLSGSLTTRAEPQVMRLALIYACLDQADQIRAEHLRAGLAVWDYCERSVHHVFGCSTGNPIADTIHGELVEIGEAGLTRSDIRDIFKRNKSSAEISNALDLLEEAGLAKSIREPSESGRPTERWFAA